MKNIEWKQSIKRQNKYPCKHCNIDIFVGEKYVSAHYNDGFIKKSLGAFHLNCFEEFKNK